MDECIAGEIVVFSAADRAQESAAGILIGSFIPGRGCRTDDLAVAITIGDPFPVVDGGTGDLSLCIAVGGIAAA